MSYSAVPAGYKTDDDDDDTLESPSFHPPKLQLPNFDFSGSSFSLDTGVNDHDRSESRASKLKSSIHSGASYEMVDSDSESNYDMGESSGEMEETGRRNSGDKRRKDQEREDEIASSGVLVSKFSSHDNALSMQGGSSNGNGNQHQQQQQKQFKEHDHSAAYGEHMHSQITSRQLDGRADSDGWEQRGGVSVRASTAESPQHDNHSNDDHPRSPRRGRRGSRGLPPLPPQSGILDPNDPAYQLSSSPDDIHPVFRHSQSVPELPPVDVESLHIQDDFRPATSASGVGDLFKDFDGVHFDTGNPEAPGFPLRSQHPLPPPPPVHHQHRQSQPYPRPQSHHSGSQASSGLVFYPAPVPAMLNLPPTLSKARPNNRNSRILAVDSMEYPPANNRHSVAYPGPAAPALQSEKDLHRRSIATLNGDHQLHNRRSLANLPPALRASQFFDSQLPPITPDLKEESAVATLDSILDASTRASAVAFTDHPSSASYGHARNRSTATQLGNYRNSVAFNVKLHPGESPRSSMEDERPDYHHYNHGDDEYDAGSYLNPESGEYHDPARLSGASEEFGDLSTDPSQQAVPTTLLAELESRKTQLRLRNRTAASAFPRGIRSTLLQLDAVAQVQQQHRRVKKTHLAWEEPDDGPDEEERDEDVPLGLLFSVSPGVQKRHNEEVPLGLLMKKEMEDAEPLSKRRERLRQQNRGAMQMPQSMRMLDVPGLGETREEEEVEGETLKERMKRLKEKQQFGSGTLDINLMSDEEKQNQRQQREEAKPEVEETLAQRRRRLQREKEQEVNLATLKRESVVLQQEVKHRRNMADILHARPVGMSARPNTFYSVQGGGVGGGNGSFGHLQQGYGQGYGQGMNMGMGGYGRPGPGLIGRGAGSMGTMGMGMGGGMMGMGGEGISDPKQMEMVERWRASVM